jgi:hypothetical protein
MPSVSVAEVFDKHHDGADDLDGGDGASVTTAEKT